MLLPTHKEKLELLRLCQEKQKVLRSNHADSMLFVLLNLPNIVIYQILYEDP